MVSIYTLIASVLYVLVANILLNILNGSYLDIDRRDVENDTFGPHDLLEQVSERMADQFCSNLTKDNNSTKKCFHIKERFVMAKGQMVLLRAFRYDPGGLGSRISSARVFIPKPLTFSNLLNTSSWKVDKKTIVMDYVGAMVTGIFVSGAVQYNSTNNYNVLILGLRGGAINNYLSTMPNQKLNITVVDRDPVMKTVAEKWYGFEETDLHRIIVDDIGDYVQGAFTRGEKFNVILIDLCANERRPLICPTEEISGSDVVENLATILTDAGAVIVRFLTGFGFRQGSNEAEKVRKLFEEPFEGCSTLKEGRNQMLFCFNKVEANENKTDTLLKMRKLMESKLDFNLTLDSDS